jgi:prefoldin subunit 5
VELGWLSWAQEFQELAQEFQELAQEFQELAQEFQELAVAVADLPPLRDPRQFQILRS